ncbi:MAG: hypothetical protein RMJ35_08240 [Phycisphaerales bacterium]|nr:hypothetical protein [Phycisphaerales bacterium]
MPQEDSLSPSPLLEAQRALETIRTALDALPLGERAQILDELARLVPPSPPPAPVDEKGVRLSLSPMTLQMLGLGDGSGLKVERLAPCLSALVEFVVRLDDAAWGAFRKLGGGGTTLKRQAEVRALIKALLRGNQKLTIRQVEFQIARLMRLSVELLGQINQVAEYCLRLLQQMEPQVIRLETEQLRSPLSLASTDALCWERYRRKWDETIVPGMPRSINREIARTVALTVNLQNLPE